LRKIQQSKLTQFWATRFPGGTDNLIS
jgi:hypothetical protein